MKKVYSNEELAHIWVNNGQIEARNPSNNMSFYGDKFYSYNTIIAKRVNNVIVMSTRNYSNTTAKQQGRLRQAARHNVVYCYDVNNSPAENFNTIKREIITLVDKQTRAKKIDYIAQGEAVLNEFKRYAEVMGYKLPANTIDAICEYNAKQVKQAAALKKKQQTARIKEGREFLKSVDIKQLTRAHNIARACFHKGHLKTSRKIMGRFAELNNRAYRVGVVIPLKLYPDFMRIVSGGVITSQGVNISNEEARGLYLAIKRGRDVTGAKIGHYTVSEWNKDYVKIGCHTFPRSEFSYISERLFGEAV